MFVLTDPRPNCSFLPANRIFVQFHRKSPLYFQQLRNSCFAKSFVLKSIRTAPGGGGYSCQGITRSHTVGAGACLPRAPMGPSRRPHDHTVNPEAPNCPDYVLTPLDPTLASHAQNCPHLQKINPLESGVNLLSPLELTLTKNAPVSPLKLTLTKSRLLKSHQITLLQKGGSGYPSAIRRSR